MPAIASATEEVSPAPRSPFDQPWPWYYIPAVSRFAIIATLCTGLLLSVGCSAFSNNNAYRDPAGPDINEVTGKEMPPDYGLIRQ